MILLLSNNELKKDICSMKKVCDLLIGSCFGEIGAILDKPRTATIVCAEPSIFLTISFGKYLEIFTHEQIYELNFRVLNLSQIFSNKAVGSEVIAHLSHNFYQIPFNTTVYKYIIFLFIIHTFQDHTPSKLLSFIKIFLKIKFIKHISL